MLLSILIPVYNEEPTLKSIIEAVLNSKLPIEVEKEIIVINDGSTDQSASILESFKKFPQIQVFHHIENLGKTNAIRLGIQKSKGDVVMVQDADLEYHPDQIKTLIQPILDNKASIVYGSRFLGKIESMKFINRFANVTSNILFNLLYPVKLTDINTCYKIFKRELLQSLKIESEGFTFETEVTAKLVNRGHKILELPIEYTARSKKDGKKITWSKAMDMFMGIIKYRKSR